MQTSDNYKMIGKSTNQSKVTQDIQSGIDNPFIHSPKIESKQLKLLSLNNCLNLKYNRFNKATDLWT